MTLTEYFHSVIPNPCILRPFVCDGRPEFCDVIVIGENPATEMNTDWWSFWNDDTGFDLHKFECTYEATRLARGKRGVSNTRLRLNRLRSKGLQCLETNASLKERMNGHDVDSSIQGLLPELIANLPRLKAVVAHGQVADKALNSLRIPASVSQYHLRHFRSESYQRIDEVADQIIHRLP